MYFKTRLGLALGAGALVLGAVSVAAPAASASSFSCVLSNGCATLHSVNAVGDPVAVDAKRQSSRGMVIGYPDFARDKATSFDKVLHHFTLHGTGSWQDTALLSLGSSHACTEVPVAPNASTTCADDSPTAASVTTVGAGSALAVHFAFTSDLHSIALSDNLPSGLNLAADSAAGPQTTFDTSVQLGTAVPGTYGGRTITLTGKNTTGSTFTEVVTFALVVKAVHVFVHGTNIPYYTLVYAPDGDWSNQCVTDTNSNGLLRLQQCTGGRNASQRFFAQLSGAGPFTTIPDAVTANRYSLRNGLSGGYMEDASTSNPTVPQSDASDGVLPGGRQLDVAGVNPAAANALWNWNT